MKNPLNATFESHYVGVLATYVGAATVSYYMGRSPLDYLIHDPLKAVGVLALSEAALSLKKKPQAALNPNAAPKANPLIQAAGQDQKTRRAPNPDELSDDSDSDADNSDHEIEARKQQASDRSKSPSRRATTATPPRKKAPGKR